MSRSPSSRPGQAAREPRIAVVTGGNRGIGLEVCRQLAQRGDRVVLASRDAARGQASAARLAAQGLAVESLLLDVADPTSIASFVRRLEAEHGGADVLVNNAAVYPDEGKSVLTVGVDVFRNTMETNVYGPLGLCQALASGMASRGYGRVVNVSSGAGQLSSMGDYAPSYSMSKAALNALTRMLADAVAGRGVLVNAVDPGWVRTEMGGDAAPRSVEQGAETVVWLATLPEDGPTGGFFHDRQAIRW